jgi:hypothetical protein
MAEQADRKSKRFQNTQNTPQTRNISRCRIEHEYLKAPYTRTTTINPNIDIQFDRTLSVL